MDFWAEARLVAVASKPVDRRESGVGYHPAGAARTASDLVDWEWAFAAYPKLNDWTCDSAPPVQKQEARQQAKSSTLLILFALIVMFVVA